MDPAVRREKNDCDYRDPAIRREENEPCFQQKTGVEELCKKEVDRISELPDDILASILSRLPSREATATSILSTRWRYHHTGILSLNFLFPFELDRCCERRFEIIREDEFSDYINRINQTMDSYRSGPVSNDFKVDMPCSVGANLKKWLQFALSRKVEIIDIYVVKCRNAWIGRYSFPISELITSKRSLVGLKCLKELSLREVHVDDRDIELIVSNCVLLELLSIDHVVGLPSRARVVGHCKLKHLNISNFSEIRSMEVRNLINLVSLRFHNMVYKQVLLLDNLPNLVEFDTSESYHDAFAELLAKISCIPDQLLQLKLKTLPNLFGHYKYNCMVPTLINLKHMELEVTMGKSSETDHLFPLIEACPSLEKLEFKFLWLNVITRKYCCLDGIRRRLVDSRFNRENPNYNLRKVRLSGYFGLVSELELAMYLLKNAVVLQELIIEACDKTQEIRARAIDLATLHLQPVVPSSVNFVIM